MVVISLGSSACTSEVDVSTVMTLDMDAGEVQSTVVAPGLKAECPEGRFLASNDSALRRANENQGDTPLKLGTVQGRDLDDPEGAPILATFVDSPPNRTLRYHGNDHDLAVLPNGDLLLVDLAASIVPVDPEPEWWYFAYKIRRDSADELYAALGPGARTTMLVYRSTDCGNTFHFLSEWDPAQQVDDSCAFPQNNPSLLTDPGNTVQPVYNMGGSDGPLIRVDPRTGLVYMTYQCVGHLPDPDLLAATPSRYILQAKMNKTLFLVSSDSGATWATLGEFNGSKWRSGIVPLSPTQLIFGASANAVVEAKPAGPGVWLPTTLAAIEDIDPYPQSDLKDQYGLANIWVSQVLSRVPESTNKVLVAVPAQLGGDAPGGGIGPRRGNGYRIFLYDVQADTAVEIAPALPQGNNLDDFVLHLTAVDIGEGPVLLHWIDFDISANTATVRGRLILSETEYSGDFQIARKSEFSEDFVTDWKHTWPATPSYWAGDYQTGWGYPDPTNLLQRSWYHFYPVWPEPGDKVRYARVSVSIFGSANELRQPPVRPEGHLFIPPDVPVVTVDATRFAVVRSIDVGELPASAPEFQQSFDYRTESDATKLDRAPPPPS